MRVLVLGAGVIGSVYAGRLLEAGHEVILVARGKRLEDLAAHGLILRDAESGQRLQMPVVAVSQPDPCTHFDLVLVAVRAEQLQDTLPVVTAMTDGSDVLFFGNTAGRQTALVDALGQRAVFGFPAVGGTRDGPSVTYVAIAQQKTMLGEPSGLRTPRARRLHELLDGAGFPTQISPDIDAWLVGHAAFVVPIAFALYRVEVDASRLATDRATMSLMVNGTRQGFTALRSCGNTQIPANLRALYRLPNMLVIAYWARVLAGPRGELWFAAHTRTARDEMHTLAQHLHTAIRATGRPTPDLDQLLNNAPEPPTAPSS
ncbi:MAG: 2-dehydropantoate 2-reductase N-terminal domain-containing protein [Candidatus Nanopelagicales bacterium]